MATGVWGYTLGGAFSDSTSISSELAVYSVDFRFTTMSVTGTACKPSLSKGNITGEGCPGYLHELTGS